MIFPYFEQSQPTPLSVKNQHQSLKQFELDHFHQYQITDLIANRSQFYDHLLRHLWQYFQLDQSAYLQNFALIAVGGYGREEMFPLSDLDILILTEQQATEHQREKIQQFVQFLWDCGFTVGQSVRTLEECHDTALQDISIATNLLESRFLCGNEGLFEKLRILVNQKDFWQKTDFYQAKVQEKIERYQRYHNTSYNLEPDIKYSPGGLRDLHLLYWLFLRHNGSKNLEDIFHSGFIYGEEYQLLQQSQHFLFKIRFALHLILKRYDNRLLFDRQLKVSELLGYQKKSPQMGENQTEANQPSIYQGKGNQAVENMMKDFFQALQSISVLSGILVEHYQEYFLDKIAEPQNIQELDQYFYISNQWIYLKDHRCFLQSPETMLDLFYHLTQQSAVKLHSSTLRTLYLAVKGFQGELCQLPAAREKFLRLFSQPQAIERALVPMHQYGILNIYLPTWKGINGLMQFDLFHTYTVDEHSLRVLLKLESFLQSEAAEHYPICHRIFSQLTDRTLLYIAALFHDIAKGREGDHAELGGEDIADFTHLHGFNDEDIELMTWLVKQHLLMSITAQRRDIHDPEVVLHFSAQVKNQTYLDYLTCLTVADINATNETLWNTWKRSLLATLYQYSSQQLQQGMDNLLNNQEKINYHRHQAMSLLQQQSQYNKADIEALWQRCPDDYFLRNTIKQITWHTQLVLASTENILVKISNRFASGGTEIFIYCRDQANLFNKVVTTIGAKKFSIHDAQIITSLDGYVFDSFIVTELDGSLAKFDRRRELETALTKVLSSPEMPKAMLTPKKKLQHFQVMTEVRFLNCEKSDQTEMELFALDKAGLLAEVSQVFSELKLNLLNAKITTVGARAEDFFILTNQQNQALSLIERESLQLRLKQVIGS